MPATSNPDRQESLLRPVVIGTAGHVDHGKSTLVMALTGTDPDRLAEEKARSMTIDLGFASFKLPSGRPASIVDVPGHEQFIKNMLAGIGGIDLALLVVAADEGPMPQTREHLAIIDLLQIQHGVIAVTKADLADPELLGYVTEEIIELLSATTLAGASVVPVSSTARTGLDALLQVIDDAASDIVPSPMAGPARLPVDRVFTMSGFGTVVTGTMLGEGGFATGDELRIMPEGLRARVRGLQSHGTQVDHVHAGMRAALNLSGVDVDAVRRGSVVTLGNELSATRRIDVRFDMLDDAPSELIQNGRVDIFTGSAQAKAQLSLLDANELKPGGSQFVQARLEREIAVSAGDRFIARQASPSRTIGGGMILDANPKRHRRFDAEVIERLRGLESGDPAALVMAALGDRVRIEGDLVTEIATIVPRESAQAAIVQLLESDEIVRLTGASNVPERFLIDRSALDRLRERMGGALDDFHARNPLRAGMPIDEFRDVAGVTGRAFEVVAALAEREGSIEQDGPLVRRRGFQVRLDEQSKSRSDRFLAALRERPLEPPAPAEFGIDHVLLDALERFELVVCVSDTIVFDSAAHDRITNHLLTYLASEREITLAQFRDLIGTTRKYAQPLLEDFDRRRLTRRAGDVRYAGTAAQSHRRAEENR